MIHLLMYAMEWDSIWFVGSAPRWTTGVRWWFKHGDTFFVGVWTGPQRDLICVRHCDTNAEAERWLSPGSRTLWGAALKSLWRVRHPLVG